MHLQLALHLRHGVEGHADHDEDRGASERLHELVAREVEDHRGHHRDDSDEDASGQRHAMQHVLDVLNRRRARPHAGDEPSLLAQVVGRLLGVEHHGGVEVREEHDEQHGEDPVDPPGRDGVGHRREPPHVEQRRQLGREVDEATREDDGDNASRVHLERDVGGLAAHHLAPLHALGVVHRDAPLRPLDEDDGGNAREHHEEDQQRDRDAHAGVGHRARRREDGARHTRHDAREDDERHAVTHAALRDELAHPHDERGARDEREHHDRIGQKLGDVGAEPHPVGVRLEQKQVAHGVDEAEAQREVTGDLRDLPAPCLAFLRPAAHGRYDALHELHDDGRRDVGHDAEREHAEVRQRTAREQVEHGHGHTRVRERVRELTEGDAGDRHVGPEAI